MHAPAKAISGKADKSARRIMSMIRIGLGILGAIVVLGLGSQAFAQPPKSVAAASDTKPERSVNAEPNSTLASFGDWTLRCQRLDNGAESQHICEVAQQIRAKDQQTPVAELAIGRLKKADPLRLTIILPVNISFTNQPGFSADGKVPEPLALGWRKCLSVGCVADALLNDEMLRRWKAQTNAGHITWTDAAGRDLAIALSFRGLTQALDALSKEP
jgi:invasion protein IalB